MSHPAWVGGILTPLPDLMLLPVLLMLSLIPGARPATEAGAWGTQRRRSSYVHRMLRGLPSPAGRSPARGGRCALDRRVH